MPEKTWILHLHYEWHSVQVFHFGHTVLHTIWPFFAMFLMSAITFFSCCSILALSRSRSLMALFRARWFCLNISSGVFLRPKSHSKGMVDVLTLQHVESTHNKGNTTLMDHIMAVTFKSIWSLIFCTEMNSRHIYKNFWSIHIKIWTRKFGISSNTWSVLNTTMMSLEFIGFDLTYLTCM